MYRGCQLRFSGRGFILDVMYPFPNISLGFSSALNASGNAILRSESGFEVRLDMNKG